ncbi:hypothetical protein IH992_04105 [Candidatus Poribacteria bacterium]|nr:hypothetical protein [Candidatus Poribacteria bacterium]
MILGCLLASYGLTAIIIESNLFLFRWLRTFLIWCKLKQLARCYRCLGFWVGILFAILYNGEIRLCLILPFASSGASYLLSKLVPNFSLQSVSGVVVVDENDGKG